MSNGSKNLKIGIVGCGYIANEAHIPVLMNTTNVSLAICDTDKNRLSSTAKSFKIKKVYTDFAEMLEEEHPDLVDVCTPPFLHAPMAKRSLENGCSCIIEKPFTANVKEADELIELSKKKALSLYVIHNYSYVPSIRRAREIINEGKLGKIAVVDTRFFAPLQKERYLRGEHWVHQLSGGILNSEITPHLVMLLLEFLGGFVETKVSALKISDIPYVKADELQVIFKTSDNAVGHIGLSYNSTIPWHTMDIIGTKGCLFLDLFSQTSAYHKIPSYEATSQLGTQAFTRGSWALSDIMQRTGSIARVTANVLAGRYKMQVEGHRYLLGACIDAVNNKTVYPVKLEKCREVVRLLDLIGNSVTNGVV
jgi:predicted dehydrogenase